MGRLDGTPSFGWGDTEDECETQEEVPERVPVTPNVFKLDNMLQV